MSRPDSIDYRKRKAFFDRIMTVYGRKPVLEILHNRQLQCHRLHLASSNKKAPILQELLDIAQQRDIEVCYHDKRELSRISRNGKQDQGVAADIICPGFQSFESFIENCNKDVRLLAADGITNPQNAGMLMRSAVAGGIDGIVWPAAGNAALGPLAIKASAGTLLKAPLLRCEDLAHSLQHARDHGFQICTLTAEAPQTLFQHTWQGRVIFVLGNESHGVSKEVAALSDMQVSIPMHHGVESLNVAVTAALIAYLER